MRLRLLARLPMALACIALLVALDARADEVFTPHHVARLRIVTSAVVSPDGSTIAYTLSVPRRPLTEEDGPPWQELHVSRAGGLPRPYVSGQVNVSNVRFTPDGSGVSFLSRRTGDTARALHVLPLDGGEGRRVLAHETDITDYAWSPDGKRLAYLATEPLPAVDREMQRKGFNQVVFEESVPFVRVWVAAPGAEKGDRRMLPLEGSASQLAWAPSGSRLSVALAPTPHIDDELMRRQVHIVDADSGQVVAAFENRGKLSHLAWSPDARHVAYISSTDIHDPQAGRLLVATADGGPAREVLPGYLGHVNGVAWRDPETVIYLGDEGVETVLGEVRRDGTGRATRLPAGGQIVTSLAASRDGRTLALVAETPRHPGEAFLLGGEDPEPKRLSDSNPWLATVRIARQEVVSFKARDGLDLEGILIRPLDEQPNTRYPLILTVHGGPEAHDRNGWRTGYANPGQVGAAHGFAVFYPNYRGSTGRGVEFSKLGQGDPAGKEFDDLVDAVDHLIDSGLVDRERVGITGGSYGGYASAWGATYYSERFAAAVMFVGISNLVSKIGTTDIPNEEVLVHARSYPWERWDQLLERSPVYHTENARTPILIMTGTADPRVSPTQSMELYRHLKLRGQTPVRLVHYPGEPHGNRRAASRLDYNLRMMRWMEHYLQGPGGAPPPYPLNYEEPQPAAPTATAGGH
jgi:dipeptidyl aminopeptidase/acylaminoacyl peptidase